MPFFKAIASWFSFSFTEDSYHLYLKNDNQQIDKIEILETLPNNKVLKQVCFKADSKEGERCVWEYTNKDEKERDDKTWVSRTRTLTAVGDGLQKEKSCYRDPIGKVQKCEVNYFENAKVPKWNEKSSAFPLTVGSEDASEYSTLVHITQRIMSDYNTSRLFLRCLAIILFCTLWLIICIAYN